MNIGSHKHENSLKFSKVYIELHYKNHRKC